MILSDSIGMDGSQQKVLQGFWVKNSDGTLSSAPAAAIAELLDNPDFSGSLSAALEQRKLEIFHRLVMAKPLAGDIMLYQTDPQRMRTFLFQIGDGREIVVFANDKKTEIMRAALVSKSPLGAKNIETLPEELYEPLFEHDSISNVLGIMAVDKPTDLTSLPSISVAQMPSEEEYPPASTAAQTQKAAGMPAPSQKPRPASMPSIPSPKSAPVPPMAKKGEQQYPSAAKKPQQGQEQATNIQPLPSSDDYESFKPKYGPEDEVELYSQNVDLETNFSTSWHESEMSDEKLKGAKDKLSKLAAKVERKEEEVKNNRKNFTKPAGQKSQQQKPTGQYMQDAGQKGGPKSPQIVPMPSQRQQSSKKGGVEYLQVEYAPGGSVVPEVHYPGAILPESFSVRGLDPYAAQKKILQTIDEIHRHRLDSDNALKADVKRINGKLNSYEKMLKAFSGELEEFRQTYDKRKENAEAALRSLERIAEQSNGFNARIDELTAAAGELHEQVSTIIMPDEKDMEWEQKLADSLESLKEVSGMLADAEKKHNEQLEKMSFKLQQSIEKSISKSKK